MTKQQLVDDIRRLNPTASREFLKQFGENELDLYLRKLLRQEQKYGSENLLRPAPVEEFFQA